MNSSAFGLEHEVSLRSFTTLRAGGAAEWFAEVRSVEDLEIAVTHCRSEGRRTTILGSGSNVLPSDDGVPGVVIVNSARTIEIHADGTAIADTGCSLQELFLKAAQASYAGLEFAVGIPGTLGGALVSNAGAYRSNVSEFLTELEISTTAARKWEAPAIMEFAYRDSVLRRAHPPDIALLRAKLKLPQGDPKAIYDEAREYQRQRISKQPPMASAGSFFKNVESQDLADRLDTLPERLRLAGVVPAGYLIEHAGLAGFEHRGAQISRKHANFIVNSRNANATAIRELAEMAKKLVLDKFGVELEEEVLYLGDWRRFEEAKSG